MDAYLSDEMFQEMLGDFLDESTQLLDRLNENLLALDEWVRDNPPETGRQFDRETLNEMFRAAHSLKGLSAMLNLTDINQLTHKLENLFDAARKNELVIDRSAVDIMFQAADRLRTMVDALREGQPASVGAEDIVAQMAALLARERRPEPTVAESVDQAFATAEQALQEALSGGTSETASVCSTSPGTGSAAFFAQQEAERLFQGLSDEADLSSKYLALFIDELEQSLDCLTETLVTVEGARTKEALETILCTAHRVKGSAASVGFHRASKLAHLMEDVLQALRDGGRSLTPELNDCLLKATDGLREFLNQLRRGEIPQVDFVPLATGLIACHQTVQGASSAPACGAISAMSPPRTGSGQSRDADWPGPEILEKARDAGLPSLIGRVTLQPNLQLSGLKGRLLYEKLSHAGEILHFTPTLEELETQDNLETVEFVVVTQKSPDDISRLLRIAGVRDVQVVPASSVTAERSQQSPPIGGAACDRQDAPAAVQERSAASQPGVTVESPAASGEMAAGKAKAQEPAKSVETLRVDIERLDQLMNLAGQLVITRARLTELAEKLKQRLHGNRAAQSLRGLRDSLQRVIETGDERAMANGTRGLTRLSWNRLEKDFDSLTQDLEAISQARVFVNQLMEAVHQLDRVTDGIQRAVMETRMVPIGPLFNRFKRVVRDVTRINGKQIELVIMGEKTELDKRMIDELGDPLIHLVRNAADHGIEPPDVREKQGKPRTGTITLNAFHRGNSIIIQVSDDGKGLDAERILRKALDRNLISPAQAEKMSREEIYQLIFLPGLSTAEKVTEVSGRGMGMDIVKAKIEELSGAIELESSPGAGTRVTIKLPLTLAILPSLLVRIDGDVFAMPIEAVREIVAARREHLTTIHSMKTARIRDRVISVIELGELFATHCYRPHFDQTVQTETTLVILGDEEHEVGLVVDEVLGEEDVVIKSIAENYRNIPGIAGASILGNGRVSLILDVAALLSMISRRAASCSV